MIRSLAGILSDFPGAANRARCTAHIVNLVTKIILRQFDARKKAVKKTPENVNDEPLEGPELVDEDDDEELTSLAEDLDREEQEMASGDEDDGFDMSEIVAVDVEEIEAALKEEILEVAKKVKPIQRVLFKVR